MMRMMMMTVVSTAVAVVACKYCGQKRQSVQALVSSPCLKHPAGMNKGKHVPVRRDVVFPTCVVTFPSFVRIKK